MKASLNENIRLLRSESAISQVEFAKALNVSKQCVSNWENDNVQPSVEMLVKIADFFLISVDQLLGREFKETVDISGLNEKQSAHIRLLIKDFLEANQE